MVCYALAQYYTFTKATAGTIPIDKILQWIRPNDPHCPRTAVVALENTQNWCGGLCLPLPYIEVQTSCLVVLFAIHCLLGR